MSRKDTRYVYGVGCLWHESIHKVAKHPTAGLPCCPHCKGMLLELPNEEAFWTPIKKYAEDYNNPEYIELWKWLKGKCFKTYEEACAAYGRDK